MAPLDMLDSLRHAQLSGAIPLLSMRDVEASESDTFPDAGDLEILRVIALGEQRNSLSIRYDALVREPEFAARLRSATPAELLAIAAQPEVQSLRQQAWDQLDSNPTRAEQLFNRTIQKLSGALEVAGNPASIGREIRGELKTPFFSIPLADVARLARHFRRSIHRVIEVIPGHS